MSKNVTQKENLNLHKEILSTKQEITPFDLRLVNKKILLKYSTYKISTTLSNMSTSESIAISQKGVLFNAQQFYDKGTLMRVWIEIPDYWSRKSKHVDYRHTEAPSHFQMLSRVIHCEQISDDSLNYRVLCENLNMDTIDQTVLQDYLVTSSGANSR